MKIVKTIFVCIIFCFVLFISFNYNAKASCIQCGCGGDDGYCMDNYPSGTTCYIYPYYREDAPCLHGATSTTECPPCIG